MTPIKCTLVEWYSMPEIGALWSWDARFIGNTYRLGDGLALQAGLMGDPTQRYHGKAIKITRGTISGGGDVVCGTFEVATYEFEDVSGVVQKK